MRIKKRQHERKFRSKLEEVAWREWVPTQECKVAEYEPISFNTAGGRYTPDFVLTLMDDTLLIVEVKGSWKQPGGARSKRIMKEAANQFPSWGKFIALLPKKVTKRNGKMGVTGWIIEEYN